MFLLRTLAVLLGIMAIAQAHLYPTGCSKIIPQPKFQMSRFLGTWYIIQMQPPVGKCRSISYTPGDEPGQYIITPITVSGPYAKGRRIAYEWGAGYLKMFPSRVVETVFATDYYTYAGILFCGTSVPCECSAIIMARTRELNGTIINELRGELSRAGVDLSKLGSVPQTDCKTFKEKSHEAYEWLMDKLLIYH